MRILFNFTIIIQACLFAGTAGAWEAGQEKDPFYPSERRPAAAVPAPDAGWGKDPFSNPFGGKGAAPQSQVRRSTAKNLTGIIYSKDIRLAIFNGETVREGGRIGEQKIAAIRKRSVVLRNPAGGSEEIYLDDFSLRK